MEPTPKTLSELHAEDVRERQAWLAARKEGVGASEAAAVLGLSPWESPLSIYAEKTTEADEVLSDEQIERFRWGHLLERIILDELSARTGLRFRRAPQHKIIKHFDWPETPMFATPDAYVLEESSSRLAQVKTTNAFNAGEWAEGVPLHYNVQVQHEMEVCDREANLLVCLIGGQKLVWWQVERHPSFDATLVKEIQKFWHQHVIPRVIPTATGDAACVRALEKIHPKDNGEEIQLPMGALTIDRRLKELKADLKRLSDEKKSLENELKGMIGPHSYGRLPDGSGRFSWKHVHRKAYQVEAADHRALRRGR